MLYVSKLDHIYLIECFFKSYMQTSSYDFIVIGAGVIGTSVAFHLAQLGATRVLVIERDQIGAGTGAQSSGILRTHYSVTENVLLAHQSWDAFAKFDHYLDDAEASSGIVPCGYMIATSHDKHVSALHDSIVKQREMGIDVQTLDALQAKELLPIAQFSEHELIGFEPKAGFADAYLVNTGFAKAARRRGVKILEGVAAQGLLRTGHRVTGVRTSAGDFHAQMVISTQSIWALELNQWLDIKIPLKAERHTVLALESKDTYTNKMPVFKDLDSPGMLYYRSYGGKQMLVSEGSVGETLAEADNNQGDVSLDTVIEIGEQVSERFEAYAEGELASSWTGVYDVTPDWNPVLGPLPNVEGLLVGFGFSGHGFKLSPAVGKVLAQAALGLKTDVALEPYNFERFEQGRLLVGKYGAGAVS
jgi:sarcosine oxidase, subunit beta